MAHYAHWAALCALAISVSVPAQDTPDDAADDIVVVARKMRKVRLDYALYGPYLRRCDVAVSSGDGRIDRVMCAVLKACVREGHHDVAPARRCVIRKIDSIETYRGQDEGKALAEPMLAAAVPKAGADAAADKQPNEVVVTARQLPTAGYWRFRLMRAATISTMDGGTSLGESPPPTSWGRCIKSGETETTLQQMIGKDVSYSASGVCRYTKLDVAGGRIVGERRCLYRSGRSLTTINGSYNADRVRYDERTDHVGVEGNVSGGGGAESVTVVNGARVGDCRAK